MTDSEQVHNMKIRQIALVTEDLVTVRDQLFFLLGLDTAYEDPDVALFGLRNFVATIGNTFLEVVSPVQDGTTAGRLLERRGGDGGYMVIVQVEDFDAARNRVRQHGIRTAWQHEDNRLRSMHLHPKDVPGALPSMDAMDKPEEWYYAGPDWRQRAAKFATAIVAAQVQVLDPAYAAGRWAAAYGTDYTVRDGQLVIAIGDTEVRFAPVEDGRGEGLQAIDIATDDISGMLERAGELRLEHTDNRVIVCGTLINFVSGNI